MRRVLRERLREVTVMFVLPLLRVHVNASPEVVIKTRDHGHASEKEVTQVRSRLICMFFTNDNAERLLTGEDVKRLEP